MTISAGWVSWAMRVSGPADKVYSQRNSCQGFACHSVVGRERDFEDGIPNRFLDTSRKANGDYTDAAAASVHFVQRESGLLIQMYPIYASTWTSGGRQANTSTISMEAEGGLFPNYGELLTPAAEDSFCRLMRELRPIFGPPLPGVTLFQHKDLAIKYGTSATACASDRYRNAWARAVREYQEDDMALTEEQINAMIDKRIAEKLYNSQLIDSTQIPLLVAQIIGGVTDANGNIITEGYSDPAIDDLIMKVRERLGV